MASAGFPPHEIVDQLARWTTNALIIEHVAPTDPMFQARCGHRRLDLSWMTLGHLADLIRRRFRITHSEEIVPGQRCLLLCRRLT